MEKPDESDLLATAEKADKEPKVEVEQQQVAKPTSPEKFLLHGPMPELKKMKIVECKTEIEMWRNLWAWIPADIKYFVARTGKSVRLVRRDYKGFLGVLLETTWKLENIDLGTFEKVYDSNSGKYFFERKIIKIGSGQIINIEWIEQRDQLEDEQSIPVQETETYQEMQSDVQQSNV